jgi:hypothetical protein
MSERYKNGWYAESTDCSVRIHDSETPDNFPVIEVFGRDTTQEEEDKVQKMSDTVCNLLNGLPNLRVLWSKLANHETLTFEQINTIHDMIQ